jgi:hypothetical protein
VKPGHQPGGRADADGLPDDQADDDADRDAVGERRAESRQPSDGDPGGEEREHRHGHAGRDRAEAVLEVLGQPRSGVRATGGLAAHHRDGEGEQHRGDRGVHAGLVHQHPGDGSQREQQPPGPDAALDEKGEVAADELALEFEPGDEEEDGQQPVGRPGAQRQVQVQGSRADPGVTDRLEGRRYLGLDVLARCRIRLVTDTGDTSEKVTAQTTIPALSA